MDYSHGSEIEWGLIKPFRLAGLIYTEGGGVDDIADEIPELDPSKLSELSDDAIETLLEYIESRGDLSPSLKEKIRAYIIENGSHKSTDLTDEIQKAVDSTLGFTWKSQSVTVDSEKVQHWRTTDIKIKIKKVFFPSDSDTQITHTISVTEPVDEVATENYTTWETNIEGDNSWRIGITALQQKADLAEKLKQILTDQGLKLGAPPKLV